MQVLFGPKLKYGLFAVHLPILIFVYPHWLSYYGVLWLSLKKKFILPSNAHFNIMDRGTANILCEALMNCCNLSNTSNTCTQHHKGSKDRNRSSIIYTETTADFALQMSVILKTLKWMCPYLVRLDSINTDYISHTTGIALILWRIQSLGRGNSCHFPWYWWHPLL